MYPLMPLGCGMAICSQLPPLTPPFARFSPLPSVPALRPAVSARRVSSVSSAGTTGGRTRSTRRPTRGMSGRSPSPALPTPRVSSSRSCKYSKMYFSTRTYRGKGLDMPTVAIITCPFLAATHPFAEPGMPLPSSFLPSPPHPHPVCVHILSFIPIMHQSASLIPVSPTPPTFPLPSPLSPLQWFGGQAAQLRHP